MTKDPYYMTDAMLRDALMLSSSGFSRREEQEEEDMTTEQIVVRSITIEEFKAVSMLGERNGKPPSPELLAIRGMAVNSAIVLAHTCTSIKGCRVGSVIGTERNRIKGQGRTYSVRHLSDTELAVACYARDTEEKAQ